MSMKPPKMILMVAPTGARYTKADHPAIPLTPREIAADVAACVRAGAAVAHLHARDAQGRATQDPGVYREIVARVREATDVVIQLSIGTRGFGLDEALAPVKLAPEMASLPLRNVAEQPADVRTMAAVMAQHGVIPSVDGSTLAMIQTAVQLHGEKVLADPLCLGFILGEPATREEAEARLRAFAAAVPAQALWWSAKGGAHHDATSALAIRMGGHARTGLEDVAPARDGKPLSNAELVAATARLCANLGRELATPAEARAQLAAAARPAPSPDSSPA
jgi:3-keto-5-aminohexanoate cleavage enzyme